ncbi:hypothetical protein MNEG_10905 [Monoraphidium neglectum]|uniref:Uncharacterized protein n=1 Tax=Monoraphidium neglectum TaxID=145388 RepID=A0A0D2M087_9CHLO|nr:hypothetical protein MNEG_10905 [Monoraphidium neglectum]KIY97059.1 hypothetical protein MNEG_10905 [Monoraphidium neglectum]|eukprot:XP_013896079.1 hypothetical protein MNEG_10905 [Monoraphidium neglectum]
MRRRPPSEAAGEQEQEQEEEAVTLQALWAHEEVRPLLQVRPLPQPAPLRGGRWLCLDARGCLLEVGGTPHAATAPAAGAGAGAAASRRRADGGSERLPLAGRTLWTLAELPVGAGPRFALVACDGGGGSGCGAGATWYVVSCGPDGGLLRAAPLPPADAAALLSPSTGDAEGGASGGPAAVRLGRRLFALGTPAHPLCAPCSVAAAMVGGGVREALMRAPFDGLM